MLTKLMGASVFAVGFIMLLLGLLDLLGVAGFNYDLGRRLLIYVGGVVLCLIGYFMARRLPAAEEGPPEEIVQTTTEVQREGPPTEHF